VDTEYAYYSWCMASTDIVKWRKTNDYENLEKGIIMKILKKGGGGSREKGGGGNEIHAPCACEQSQPVLAQLHQSANIRISDFTFTDI
jgi:prenyltransferase beta subunit